MVQSSQLIILSDTPKSYKSEACKKNFLQFVTIGLISGGKASTSLSLQSFYRAEYRLTNSHFLPWTLYITHCVISYEMCWKWLFVICSKTIPY